MLSGVKNPMNSQEHDKLRKAQNTLHKRLCLLRKSACPNKNARVKALEQEMSENQALLKKLKRKGKREKSKIMKAYGKADDIAKAKQAKRIEKAHAISEFNSIEATFVQGGAPSLGKGKS